MPPGDATAIVPLSPSAECCAHDPEDRMAAAPEQDKPFFLKKSPRQWIELLGHARAPQRRQAALALGQLGLEPKTAVKALAAALADTNELVRRQAAESL